MGVDCSNRKNVIKKIDKIDSEPLNYNNIQDDTTQLEFEYLFRNNRRNKWQHKKIQITITKVNDVIQVKYLLDGQILRIDQQKDIFVKPQLLSNLDQIYYLEWLGKYQENFKKIGKWTVIWKGEQIIEVGGYYSEQIYQATISQRVKEWYLE